MEGLSGKGWVFFSMRVFWEFYFQCGPTGHMFWMWLFVYVTFWNVHIQNVEATVVIALDAGTLDKLTTLWIRTLDPIEQVYSGETYCEPLILLACIVGYVEPK
jgi:hypothetical protein